MKVVTKSKTCKERSVAEDGWRKVMRREPLDNFFGAVAKARACQMQSELNEIAVK